ELRRVKRTSMSRGRSAWCYPSSRADWEWSPAVLAFCRADEAIDRGARGTRHAVPVSDTSFESNIDILLHRATSHKQRLASDLGSVLRANETRPPRVPPGGVHVPAKAATRSPQEKGSYVDPGSKKREVQ